MREIKFRGKRVSDGEWVYGDLSQGFDEQKGRHSVDIFSQHFEAADMSYPYPSLATFWNEVDPETVGQFTGLKDKNGKEIYEGDKVKRVEINYAWDEIDNPKTEKFIEETSIVQYRGHGFWIKDEFFGWEGEGLWDWEQIEVIGNIHDSIEPNK